MFIGLVDSKSTEMLSKSAFCYYPSLVSWVEHVFHGRVHFTTVVKNVLCIYFSAAGVRSVSAVVCLEAQSPEQELNINTAENGPIFDGLENRPNCLAAGRSTSMRRKGARTSTTFPAA